MRGIRGAFVRRALIERAKGVLIERHGVDEREAFEMLRDEARRNRVRMAVIADAVLQSTPTAESAAATS